LLLLTHADIRFASTESKQSETGPSQKVVPLYIG